MPVTTCMCMQSNLHIHIEVTDWRACAADKGVVKVHCLQAMESVFFCTSTAAFLLHAAFSWPHFGGTWWSIQLYFWQVAEAANDFRSMLQLQCAPLMPAKSAEKKWSSNALYWGKPFRLILFFFFDLGTTIMHLYVDFCWNRTYI